VHTVVGENGSGKSTLVKILTGVIRPDAGTIAIGGKTLSALRGPRAARAMGIAGVFQNVLVVGSQSVVDNVWLGADGIFRRRLSEDERRARAASMLSDLLGAPPDLDVPAGSLSLGERQACAVARALVREPEVLILDEATSALDVTMRNRLFEQIRRLVGTGACVVFISHRLDEVEEISDVVTVLRAGETTATVPRAAISPRELVRLMTGVEDAPERPQVERAPGDVVLSARGLVLRAGELVGVAGLDGQGQESFLHSLARDPCDGAVAYVPRDRRQTVFEGLSIRDNFALPTLREDRRAGLISNARTTHRLAGYRSRLRITLVDARAEITTLSGGNQQKVVLARWLADRPRVLLLDDPTRGIDHAAKRDVYELLTGLAAEGVAVVLLSTDLDELVELADRVLVFREGAVAAELDREHLTRRALVASLFDA